MSSRTQHVCPSSFQWRRNVIYYVYSECLRDDAPFDTIAQADNLRYVEEMKRAKRVLEANNVTMASDLARWECLTVPFFRILGQRLTAIPNDVLAIVFEAAYYDNRLAHVKRHLVAVTLSHICRRRQFLLGRSRSLNDPTPPPLGLHEPGITTFLPGPMVFSLLEGICSPNMAELSTASTTFNPERVIQYMPSTMTCLNVTS